MRVLLLVFVTAAALQADHIIESPLIGGSRSQTARITVLGVGESCEVTLGFRDINGVPPVDPELTVRPGRDQIVFHELNFNSVVSRLGQRYEFRARLTFAQPPDPGRPQCLPSLEIYEQLTKRTTTLASFRYPDGFILYDANGDGITEPTGGAYGQTLRLAALAELPSDAGVLRQCAAELQLRGPTGTILATKVVAPAPGQGDKLDMNMNTLVRFGERMQIVGRIVPRTPGGADGCKISLQAVDQFTGWSSVVLAPLSRSDEPSRIIESPLIGGSRAQTARLTVVAVGDLCEVTLGFRDINGVPPPDPDMTVRLIRDQIAFHEFNFNSVVTRLGQRHELRGRLTFSDPPDPDRPQCLASLEIYEQITKRTTAAFLFDVSSPSLTPLGTLPGAAAWGQTIRLGVLAQLPSDLVVPQCAGELQLRRPTGTVLARKSVDIRHPHGDFLDLNMNPLVAFGERMQIVGRIVPPPGGDTAGCKLSLQAVDQFTGWTQTLVTQP